MAEISDVFFVDGVRTPFGRAGEKGMYWNTRADDLAVKTIIETFKNDNQSANPGEALRTAIENANPRMRHPPG